jgi:hypothetical protein
MDVTEVAVIVLKKESKETKCSDHCTVSLIAHTAKIVARMLQTLIARKVEDVLGKD